MWTGDVTAEPDVTSRLQGRLLSTEIVPAGPPRREDATSIPVGRMSRYSDGRAVLGVALVFGLLLRAILFWQTSDLGTVIVDEQQYTQLATNVLGGAGLAWDAEHPTSLRPPLYPGLLAALWVWAGPMNFQAARFVQILLALVTAAVVYELGRRVFRPAVGRYGAAVCWLYPSLIFFNFTILTETLFTLLLVAFVLLTVMLVQTPRAWIALVCGLSLGLAALTRSILWPLPLVLCPLLALLLRESAKDRLVLPALVFIGYAVAIGPWAVRNTRLQHVFTVVDTMGGINLRMGNYAHTPNYRMWDAVMLEGDKNWATELGVEQPGREFTDGEKEKWAQRKAIAYMRDNPGTTLRRSVIKFADFWGLEREFAAGIQERLYDPPHWFGIAAPVAILVGYATVALLGAAGMWLAAPAWRMHILLLLPVVVITGAHTIVFGHSRYHVPLMPIFGLYAAALVRARQDISWPQHRRALCGAVLAAVGLFAIWIHQVAVSDISKIRAFVDRVI